jgi:acyl-CoA synthetase (AMP-forming)/AMP-acid ligase II
LIAYVVPRDDSALGPDDLSLWLEDRLVHYKRPSEYRIVETLPLTAAGKIDKQALKHEAQPPSNAATKEQSDVA